MPQSLELNIKSSVFDRDRSLIIMPEYIEFEDHDLTDPPQTKFWKLEIAAIRYGIKWVRGYKFYIGRIYCIDIRNIDSKIIKIRLKSIYGINKHRLRDKYATILKALFDNFINDISKGYLEKFNEGDNLDILGVIFSNDGIFLNKKSEIISWLEVGTRSYQTYYTIFDLKDPNKYRAFDYLSDWNAAVLYSVSRGILRAKGFLN